MLDRIARSEATIIAAVGEIARRQKRKPAASVRLALVVRHTLYARNYSLRRVGEIHLRAERARISLLFGAETSEVSARGYRSVFVHFCNSRYLLISGQRSWMFTATSFTTCWRRENCLR